MAKSDKLIVNAEGIIATAEKLRTVNNNINNSFDTLKKRMSQFESNWNSAAGEQARTVMYRLFKGNESRSAVIKNYVNMLEQQVSEGYVNTENVNTSIADMFK